MSVSNPYQYLGSAFPVSFPIFFNNFRADPWPAALQDRSIHWRRHCVHIRLFSGCNFFRQVMSFAKLARTFVVYLFLLNFNFVPRQGRCNIPPPHLWWTVPQISGDQEDGLEDYWDAMVVGRSTRSPSAPVFGLTTCP